LAELRSMHNKLPVYPARWWVCCWKIARIAFAKPIVDGQPNGEITSGTFSPPLERSIAQRVPIAAQGNVKVDIRGNSWRRARAYPFARNGKACIEL
jgi:glycine cleavage system aminomethyltransferase T